jgi:hypothetical protein
MLDLGGCVLPPDQNKIGVQIKIKVLISIVSSFYGEVGLFLLNEGQP